MGTKRSKIERCANPACRQPLARVPMGDYYRLVCNNWHCPLHKEGQGNIPNGEPFVNVLDGLAVARKKNLAGIPSRKGVKA